MTASMDSQDSLADLLPLPEGSEPATPRPAHASTPETAAAVAKTQSRRADRARSAMTPPPSTQVPSSNGARAQTPTPTSSHISTPPPTVAGAAQSDKGRQPGAFEAMTADEIASASPDELRTKVTELQAALHDAHMSAAHHRLQYNMLSQESAAAIERMAVEARMAQYENDVIHVAEQARAAATTPAQPSPLPEGMIPVQKDMYQRMCGDIQHLTQTNQQLEREHSQQQRLIARQETEIASLSDKVTLMRERIRENREHLIKLRNRPSSQIESTPRSIYSTPQRPQARQDQSQPFAALLQASEMASERMAFKKGHTRNTHSTSSLPVTPQRVSKQPPLFQTPTGRQLPMKVPSTAPVPRMSSVRMPHEQPIYAQPPAITPQHPSPPSDDTVSNPDGPDADDNDSEAETDVIEPEDTDEVAESQASHAASQMLRPRHEQEAKRDSFKGSGMLARESSAGAGDRMRQTKLFGAVRKSNVERGGQPPAKRQRTDEPPAVGLGIAGVRH